MENPKKQKDEDELYKSFRDAALPLIKYLNENHHPHTTIIITHTSAEVLEGIQAFYDSQFVKD